MEFLRVGKSRSMGECTALKVVVLGDSGVGKTSMIQAFESGAANPNPKSTIGSSFIKRMIDVGDGVIREINVWDTAGQERFHSLIPLYLRNVSSVLLVFDVTCATALENIERYYEMTLSSGYNPPMVVCGNKCENEDKIYDHNEIMRWAKDHNFPFYLTSALTQHNITEAFITAAIVAADAEQLGVDQRQNLVREIVGTEEDEQEKRNCC